MNRTAQYLTYWAELDWKEFRQHVYIYGAAAIMLTILGPYGTFNQSSVWRFAYWFVTLSFFGGVILPLAARLFSKVGWVRESPFALVAALVIGGATAPMAVVIHVLDIVFRYLVLRFGAPESAAVEQLKAEAADPVMMGWSSYLVLYFEVLTVVVFAVAIVTLVVEIRAGSRDEEGNAGRRPGSLFYSRLPDHLGTELLYLQKEDHYLRVVTKLGETLILTRLRDAVQELESVDGLQVHRSWWVATGAIEKFNSKGRKPELTMVDGSKIPVSATYKAAVEELFSKAETPPR